VTAPSSRACRRGSGRKAPNPGTATTAGTASRRPPEALEVASALAGDRQPGISAPNATESLIVLSHRYGPVGRTVFERVRQEFNIAVVNYTEAHIAVAQRAFVEYGKGRHPAALNFGDCMAYAAAQLSHEPLLAVGDGFSQTDIVFEGLTGYWPTPG
jgi:ribonuclease VapC